MQTLDAVDESLAAVRQGLDRRVAALSGRVGDHLAEILGRPGKMLRARYALLLGAALGVEKRSCESIAQAVELVHGASLLHDDCVDNATARRGFPTPNSLFGTTTGILLGDLSFTEGMAEAACVSPGTAASLLRAVREMTVGELQEEFLCGSLNVSVEGYYGVAVRKTGALFEWCGEALSALSPMPHRRQDPPRLGRDAGILLQIVDDIHDFTLPEAVSGKEQGRDFFNGRLTLPGVLAMDDESARPRFLKLWNTRKREDFPALLELLQEGGYLEGARERARAIMTGMLPVVDALPERSAAAELRSFMELMFKREF